MANNKLTLNQKINNIESSNNINDVSLDARPDVYDDEFYFISYCHSDYKKVFSDLLRMEDCGARFWYDEGLPPGKNWQSFVKERLHKFACKAVILYASIDSALSDAVFNEIVLAENAGKQIVVIYLDDKDARFINAEINKRIDGSDIDIKKKEKLKNLFSDKNLYIDYNLNPENKIAELKKIVPICDELKIETIDSSYTRSGVDECSIIGTNNHEIINLIIPKSFSVDNKDYYVSTISKCAFANCKLLESVDFNSFNLNILQFAFFGCESLAKVYLRKAHVLADYCFADCINLKDVKFDLFKPVYLSEDTFKNCVSIENIKVSILNDSLPARCFSNCSNLYSIKINLPVSNSNIFTFDDNSLSKCKSLRSIEINNRLDDLKLYLSNGSFNGCENLSNIKAHAKKAKVTLVISEKCCRTFMNCSNFKFMNYKFDFIDNAIPSNCFAGSSISDLTIFSNYHRINCNAFSNCDNLRKITIPQQCYYIHSEAFSNCKNLRSVSFESDNLVLEDHIFLECNKLKEIYMPMITEQANIERAFKNSSLIYIYFKNSDIDLSKQRKFVEIVSDKPEYRKLKIKK